jgi:hypothetical protein
LAEKKAEKITNMIGYPEYIVNNTALNEKYKKLEINQVRYYRMVKMRPQNCIFELN